MQASDTDEGGTSDDRDGADNDDAIARIEAELERSRAGTLDDRQETVESAWDATGRSSLSDGGDAMRLIEAELGAESETRVEGKSELGVGKQEDWPFTDSDEESTFDKSEKAEPEPEPKSEPEPKPEPEPEPEPELAPEQKQPDVDPRIAGVQFVKEQQEHALRLASGLSVKAMDTGEEVVLRADSICVHGDKPSAVEQARGVRDALLAEGFTLCTLPELMSSAD